MNNAYIIPTEFKNARDGDTYYGVRVFDDYGASYFNGWDEIPSDNLKVIELVLMDAPYNDVVCSIVNTVEDNKTGVYVDTTWYAWEDIKHLWEQ